TDDLRVGARRTRNLPAFADLDLDIVHDGADRNIAERHGIARLHVGMFGRDHGVADAQALWRQDVGELAVLVLDQSDKARAVGIIFEPLDGRRHVKLGTFEVDLAVGVLVAAAAEARGDATVIIAAAGRALSFSQGLERRSLMQTGTVDVDQLALARRRRIVSLQCHDALLTTPWSRRCGDPLRGSRPRASRRTAVRACCGRSSTYRRGSAC